MGCLKRVRAREWIGDDIRAQGREERSSQTTVTDDRYEVVEQEANVPSDST